MYCLNRQCIPYFYPKKAPKKGDVLSKQTTRLCLFLPIWLKKNSLQIIRRLFFEYFCNVLKNRGYSFTFFRKAVTIEMIIPPAKTVPTTICPI